ncbi:hypothetical protein ACHAP5_010801 [Fusarium lateritium]
MHFTTFLSLLTTAAALPTAPTSTVNKVAIARDEIVPSIAHLERSEQTSFLVARAILDQTHNWPVTVIDVGHYSFQIRLEKQTNSKYKLNWWNTDPANSNRKIKLTLNSDSGKRIFDIVTSPQTHGTTEITPSSAAFRAIFDEE